MVATNPVLSWIIWILFIILFFSVIFLMEKKRRREIRAYEKKADKETKEKLMKILTDKSKILCFSDKSAEIIAKGIMRLGGFKEVR